MANEITPYIGSFDLTSNDIVISDINEQLAKTIQEFALPKEHGSIIPIGKRKTLTIRVKGSIKGTNYDDLRGKLDLLKAALESTAEQALKLDDDRFLNVQYRSFAYSWVNSRALWEFSFDVIASFPFWQSVTLTTDSGSRTSALAFVVNNPGNAKARVKVTITAGGSPIADDLKIENATTGEAFQYRGTLAATKNLVVDNKVSQATKSVTNDGSNDLLNFEGDFMNLATGNNSITLTSASGPLVVAIAFRATYL